MRKAALISLVLVFLLGLVCTALVTTAAEEPAKIKTLLITGDDVSSHKWKDLSECTNDILTKSGRFDVKVVEGFSVLDSKDDLQKYDVVVFMLYNAKKAPISDQAKENLVNFIKDGKGFVVCHLASASFPQWEEWGKICGRYWLMGKSGHGPKGEFEVKIVDKESPIIKGLEDFKTDDELYGKLLGDAKIHVLAEAYSDWSKKVEPLVWTQDYGKGRVFAHTFGHDKKAFEAPGVQKIIARGCQWAATGKVAE